MCSLPAAEVLHLPCTPQGMLVPSWFATPAEIAHLPQPEQQRETMQQQQYLPQQ